MTNGNQSLWNEKTPARRRRYKPTGLLGIGRGGEDNAGSLIREYIPRDSRCNAMGKRFHRRQVLKVIGAACGASLVPSGLAAVSEGGVHAARIPAHGGAARVAGQETEIQITAVSERTFRLSILPIASGTPVAIPQDGSLVRENWGAPAATMRGEIAARTVRCGNLRVRIEPTPLTYVVESASGEEIQR